MEREGDYGVRTRRCTRCGHWLCRWNPGPDCWHHGGGEDDEQRLRMLSLELATLKRSQEPPVSDEEFRRAFMGKIRGLAA